MEVDDKIYGTEEIKEDILIELINSKAVQRLKKISQFGPPQRYCHKKTFSRYEHSIGVLILLRRFNADLKEQVAGLLHDVSHTAFSHVIDWVVGDPMKDDYQDKIHLQIIKESDIPEILYKYEIDYHEIAEIKNFSLLEREIPHLCADRLDYSLREIANSETHEEIDFILKNLINLHGKFLFVLKDAAEFFANSYMKCQIEHWSSIETRTRYYLLAKALKIALDKKIISIDDMKKTDDDVIHLLLRSNDDEIFNILNLLESGDFLYESCFLKDETFLSQKKKFRYVDPEIIFENKTKRLSEFSEEYNNFLNKQKALINSEK